MTKKSFQALQNFDEEFSEDPAVLLATEPRPLLGRRRALVGLVGLAAAAACAAVSLRAASVRAKPSLSQHGLLSGEALQAYERLDRMLADIEVDAVGVPAELNQTKLAFTQCSVDVTQTAAYLGQAVVWIDKSITYAGYTCPDNTQRGCTVSVATVMTSMFWIMSYLSLTASSCSATLDAQAACAADVTAIAADMGEIATCSTAAADDCHFPSDKPEQHSWASVHRVLNMTRHISYAFLGRRLSDITSPSPAESPLKAIVDKMKEHIAKREEEKQLRHNENLDLTLCVLDVVQSASYVIRAVKQIAGATVDTCGDKKVCSISIFNIISTFAWLSQFLSYAAADCAVETNQRAYCAGDISDIIAGTTNLVATASVLDVDCGAAAKVPVKTWPSDKELEEVQETKRRLRAESDASVGGA